MTRRTNQRVPCRRENGDELDVIMSELSEEFHRQNFAEIGPRDHDTSKGEVRLGLREEVRTDDEASVDDGHILQSCIFVDKRPDDGEVDVRRGQLASGGKLIEADEIQIDKKRRTDSQLNALSGARHRLANGLENDMTHTDCVLFVLGSELRGCIDMREYESTYGDVSSEGRYEWKDLD